MYRFAFMLAWCIYVCIYVCLSVDMLVKSVVLTCVQEPHYIGCSFAYTAFLWQGELPTDAEQAPQWQAGLSDEEIMRDREGILNTLEEAANVMWQEYFAALNPIL